MEIQFFYPEKAYPDLYGDVMMLRLFPDSKTFADAIPLLSSEEINSIYQQVNRSDRLEILNFIHRCFQLPEDNLSSKTIESRPIIQHIASLWNQLLREPDKPKPISSLIPLPYSYVVPGGRFREIYYWDSYFTMLGLRACERNDVISDMIRNFAWQLEHIGHIPNGNRSYFLSRSQPPFFALMVTLLAQDEGSEIYKNNLPHLIREYGYWMNGSTAGEQEFERIVKTGAHYLNRYFDDSNTPRAESWAEDVSLKNETPEAPELYRQLRAACESGWDFSSRWLENSNDLSSIRTTDIIPIDLNSLLYILEKTIETAYGANGNTQEAIRFGVLAQKRAELIQEWLWNEEQGIFSDLIYRNKEWGVPSLALMYPLFAGIANADQAKRTIEYLTDHFLRPGGWVTTNQYTGQQWDAPNGWAPLQWITYIGLKKYGYAELAKESARRWLTLNENVFNRTGRMMEKYNVEDLTLDAGGGEYPVQDGFGWTNGVYLALKNEIQREET